MITYLTSKDYEKIRAELHQKEARIRELTGRLGEAARKSGSFVNSNPEYMGIKSQIDTLESVVSSIKNLLSKVEVRDLEELNKKIVTNYSLVNTIDQSGEEQAYYIQIPFIELRHRKDIIVASPESPVGKALLGSKVGDTVEVNVPNNKKVLTIKEIEKA